MLNSMTGFARCETTTPKNHYTAELRSVNHKFIEIAFRLPSEIREYEHELRQMIIEKVQRGRIDLTIHIDSLESEPHVIIDEKLFLHYFKQVKAIAQKVNVTPDCVFESVMKIGEVFRSEKQKSDIPEWKKIKSLVLKTVADFNRSRQAEGKKMEKELLERVTQMIDLLAKVQIHEQDRTDRLKEKLKQNIEKYFSDSQIDRNRMEQELFYYLERMDIAEEKVRLKSHCDLFLATLKSVSSEGKKLEFISQEMLREINTLGSKAQHAPMQTLVVQMKEEQEKIREQLQNVI